MWILFLLLLSAFLPTKPVLAQSINNITIDPELDISWFSSYSIGASIADYSSSDSVSLSLSAINGDGGSNWDFYADGSPYENDFDFDMTYLSGTTWQKTSIRPDYIYPTIFFAPASTTWNYSPSNLSVRRNDYTLLHLQNSFNMTNDMNFWIEINAVPNSTVNSADLQVYLVKKGKDITFFQSDWRPSLGDPDVELIGTISRTDSFDHTHSNNSSHYLITLTPNSDGTVGVNHLDISNDFWIILYNTSPNIARGWNLRYHASSICDNTNGWYRGNQTGWTTTVQSGCPDSHVHFLRRDVGNMDGVLAVVSAGSTSASQSFYYGTIPNLPPTATRFINPNGGSYSGNINVNWNPATDVNIGDTLTYTTYLLDSSGNQLQTLSSDIGDTGFVFDSTTVSDGTYGLEGKVCDQEASCVSYYTDDNFIINNTSQEIFTLNSVRLYSSNTNSNLAVTGDTINLTYTASGGISAPDISFYSAGYPITNSVTTTNTSGNTWISSFIVSSQDTDGEISFTLNSSLLDQIFYETTDSSYVVINNPDPTPTPTSTPSNSSSTESTNSSNTSLSVCTDSQPQNAPDLFQIDVTDTGAKIFYAPVRGNNTSYYLAYGHLSNNPIYGAVINQGQSTGVLSFDINHLKPNTTYYLKIRGQNGCMPGDWSNELKIKTTNNSGQKISFYKYSKLGFSTISQKVKNVFIKKDSSLISSATPTPIPKVTQSPTQTSPVEKPKKCFLWWCW